MASGNQKIPRCQVGGDSLVSAAYANQLIDFINSISGAKISPVAGVGSFAMSGGQFILDLAALDARVRAVEQLGAKVNGIIAAMNNANISASCNANTSAITVTLTFPNIPNI